MTGRAAHGGGRGAWVLRLALCTIAVVAVLAAVELVMRKSALPAKLAADIVDIQTPATLAAKVRQLASTPGRKVLLLGDSLVAGRVMAEHGDKDWREHTLSADLQRRFDSLDGDPVTVVNLGMNGLLPADMETLVDALLPLKLDAIVIDTSLRSFSRDFAVEGAVNSRSWLKPGLEFRKDGSILRLPGPNKFQAKLEQRLLNHWTTYRLRDVLRARLLGGELRDVLQGARDEMGKAAGGDAAAAEMRLLLQVRGRYGSASLDVSNPQYAAWVRMLEKLKAANQKTVIFYATENPRLLGSLMEAGSYKRLTEQLRRSVTRYGEPFSYLVPNPDLVDGMFLDHVHVNANGNRLYGERICAEIARCQLTNDVRQSLALNVTPFLETVDPERHELGHINDFSKSAAPAYTKDKPRFDLRGFPVLSVETTGPEPLRDIIFLYHWWDKNDVSIGVRDSYHMLRASVLSWNEYPEGLRPGSDGDVQNDRYKDVFAGIPARTGAVKTAFYLQDAGQRRGSNADGRELRLFGQGISRTSLAAGAFKAESRALPARASRWSPDNQSAMSFEAAAASEISGQGVRFQLDAVASVYTVKADHALQQQQGGGEYLIGAMLPQVIGYVTVAGDYRTLSFSGTDLIRLDYDPAERRLVVDAYAYEFRERTTRGSMMFPSRDGVRVHPNLGIVNKLPPQQITITHSRGDVLAFPLWQPKGALASLAITEHADFVGIAQDTLTMYGSDTPTIVPGKGILGNGVPLTKTVFPAGQPLPFRALTRSSTVIADFVQPTVLGDPRFRAMLKEYHGRDIEIGIHCVGTSSQASSRMTNRVAEALESMREFKPVTWVDHGGRDCLWEAGWDPSSEFYIVPLLRRYGFKYVNMLGDKYDGRFSMIADNEPSNLLFYSVGLDDDISDGWKPIVFNTVPIGFLETDITIEHLEKIVKARGLINIHTYLPYEALMAEQVSGAVAKLRTNPWYDQLLANIAAASRSGDLHLGTTEQLNDFMWKVRGLHVYARGTEISVGNPRADAVPGLTIGYRSMAPSSSGGLVTLAGMSPTGSRQRDGVDYVWFDLKP